MNTTTQNSTQHSTETMRQTADTFAKGFTSAMDAWMNAWRRTTDTMLRQGMPMGFTGADVNAAGTAARSTVDEMVAPMRRQVATAVQNMIDLATSNTAELAAVGADQARFMARVAERGVDCVFGPEPAKSPEAFAMTARSVVTDCMDNATAVGERMVRIGTQGVERVGEILGGAKSCCGGRCDSV